MEPPARTERPVRPEPAERPPAPRVRAEPDIGLDIEPDGEITTVVGYDGPVTDERPENVSSGEPATGVRRTVVITGRGSERYRPPAGRRSDYRPHERVGFNPDRMAMWAVLLGVVLLLAAAASSHAAAVTHHVAPHLAAHLTAVRHALPRGSQTR
jgi:hypothetical protein